MANDPRFDTLFNAYKQTCAMAAYLTCALKFYGADKKRIFTVMEEATLQGEKDFDTDMGDLIQALKESQPELF